jgi:hypothetical protein|tara:strand:+ start:64 stop:528 length:465 start_codon:yes stop_codon:yes gene_type:complete
MANFTNIERLYNQLSEDLNEVFTKRTVFSMDNSLSDDEFDYYENVLRISYYLIREYIVNTYGYEQHDPITNKLCREWIRKHYRDGDMPMIGDVIEMVDMPNDPNPITPGTKGVVKGYTTVGGPFHEDHMDVDWENGRGLSVIVGEDEIKVVHKI